LAVESGRDERRRGRVQRERWSNLNWLQWGVLWRVACQRRALRCTVNGRDLLEGTELVHCRLSQDERGRRRSSNDDTHLASFVLRHQVRAELSVVLQVEGATSLVSGAVDGKANAVGNFPHTPCLPDLSLSILRHGKPGCSPIAPAVVAMAESSTGGGVLLVAVVVVVVCRHYYDMAL
jgi:hypothetical protein